MILPEGWKEFELPEVVWFQEGPGVRKYQFTTKGIKLLNGTNIVNNKLITDNTETYVSQEEATTKYKHFLVDEGDLIIASSGIKVDYFHKKIAFAGKKNLPLCMNTSTIRFKSLDKKILDINFFRFFLMSPLFTSQVQFHITGSAQLNFGPSHLNKMKIILPLLPTQQKIVSILEKAEKAKEWRKEADELTKDLLKAVFIEMFGEPIKKNNKWHITKIGTHLEYIKYGTSLPPIFSEKGIPFIRATNIKKGRVANNEMLYINNEEARKIEKCKLKENDLIIVRSGANTGDCTVIEKKYENCYGGYDLIFRPKQKELNSVFLNELLNTGSCQAILETLSRRAGQPHLNSEQISNFEIPLPPLPLQQKFALTVKEVEAMKEQQKHSKEHIDTLFNALMQKAFKGELIK